MRQFSRRGFLKVSVAGVGLAGCAGGGDDGQGMRPAAPGEPPPSTPPPSPPPGGMSPPNTAPPTSNPPGQTTQPPGQTTQPPTTQPPATEPPPATQPPAGPMLLRPLGATGLMVSAVGFGGGSQFLRAGEAEAEMMIHKAVELGINYFDTAISYGSAQASQKRYGKHLVPMYRNRIVLVSKIDDRTGEGAKRQLDLSLQALGTDHLDIMHLHHIDSIAEVDRIMAKGGAYEVAMQAKAQGMVKFIGVSGHSTGAILINALSRIKPDVVMCPQNAAREAGFTDMVLTYGKQNGIGLLGMKVTAQDALMRNGVTPQQLLRYSLSLPVSAMIVGMRSMAVLESCTSIARDFKPLTEAEMAMLNARYAMLDMKRCLPYRRQGYSDGVCYA
jgi:uncharacterized protein